MYSILCNTVSYISYLIVSLLKIKINFKNTKKINNICIDVKWHKKINIFTLIFLILWFDINRKISVCIMNFLFFSSENCLFDFYEGVYIILNIYAYFLHYISRSKCTLKAYFFQLIENVTLEYIVIIMLKRWLKGNVHVNINMYVSTNFFAQPEDIHQNLYYIENYFSWYTKMRKFTDMKYINAG